jgi:hypothetical protein
LFGHETRTPSFRDDSVEKGTWFYFNPSKTCALIFHYHYMHPPLTLIINIYYCSFPCQCIINNRLLEWYPAALNSQRRLSESNTWCECKLHVFGFKYTWTHTKNNESRKQHNDEIHNVYFLSPKIVGTIQLQMSRCRDIQEMHMKFWWENPKGKNTSEI